MDTHGWLQRQSGPRRLLAFIEGLVRARTLSLGLLLLGCAACGYNDELTFGTGLDSTNSNLVGTSDSLDFATTRTVWFRLESAAAFGDGSFRLYLNGGLRKQPGCVAAKDGHICLSSFDVPQPGSYDVDAYLVESINPDLEYGPFSGPANPVFKETLITSKTLTLR